MAAGFVGLAGMLSLASACAPSNSQPGTEDASEASSASTEATSGTTTPSNEAPAYSDDERDLLDGRVDWTGEPEDLFATATEVCTTYQDGPASIEAGIDAADDLVTGSRWLARLFFIDVMRTTCDVEDPARRSAIEYEDDLLNYVDEARIAGIGGFLTDGELRADAATFCDQGAQRASYTDIADRIRSNYFSSERQVRRYIGLSFDTVCPEHRVEPAPPPPPPPKTEFGAGTWVVGEDIAPGTYRAPDVFNCYWERLSGFSGDLSDVVANDFIESGQAIVDISSADSAFTSNGCGRWRQLG